MLPYDLPVSPWMRCRAFRLLQPRLSSSDRRLNPKTLHGLEILFKRIVILQFLMWSFLLTADSLRPRVEYENSSPLVWVRITKGPLDYRITWLIYNINLLMLAERGSIAHLSHLSFRSESLLLWHIRQCRCPLYLATLQQPHQTLRLCSSQPCFPRTPWLQSRMIRWPSPARSVQIC